MATTDIFATGKVGDCKASMLTLAQFQSIHGTGWVLADGSSAAGTAYNSLTGFANIPDHRGVGLRGKDNGRGINPDGDLALGTLQSDQHIAHSHTDSGHSHAVSVNVSAQAGGGSRSYMDQTSNQGTNNTNSAVANIQNAGGNETRSKTNTVNIFIRVN